jgi:hypothetical protein
LFIDFENTQKVKLEEGGGAFDKIIIFVGRSQNKLDFELVQRLQSLGSKVEWVKIGGEGKNNLDFHLSYMLGRLDSETPKSMGFTVLSRDKGYDALLRYISENGRESRRVDNLGKGNQLPTPAPERRPSRSGPAPDRSSGSRSRRGSGRRSSTRQSSQAAKQPSQAEPSAAAGSSGTSSSSSSSGAASIAESKVLRALERLSSTQRPSTKVRFLNYLQNQHGAGKTLPPAADILEALIQTGKVVIQDNRVTYRF